MAMTPEAKVKRTVRAHLKTIGAYYTQPVTSGYGGSGAPDIIGCYQGKFFGIECKAGSNKPTELQKKNLAAITAAGGIALVINESNADKVPALLRGEAPDDRQLTFDL